MAAPTPVNVRREAIVLPTYAAHAPDPNPMFLDQRVYQGSSGRVYPLPFIDRISDQPTPVTWHAVYLENEFVRVLLLPELGGRIHRIEDRTNGYDAIYHQAVIKPALVGLAGPWCSGGIEFNWPQHHRPSTFMPAEVAIEREPDGAVTVWLGEHDPMARMKAAHGVRLRPGRSYVELVARVYNRTPDVQTFLWWANVATRVHEAYQSFFPPDVTHIADHAKRATSTFPHCDGTYYGIDYAARARGGVPATEIPRQFVPPHCRPTTGAPARSDIPQYRPDDLSWYANIPVPTSYMCMGSTGDFCGGYDHKARAGLVHVANHHISPGKKQWTWGNHEFGYAWDRHLTDPDKSGEYAPYIELMAGVYTDNQPDFSYLQPGETKTWRQHWYPIRAIGPAHAANVDVAVHLTVERETARIGVAATGVFTNATVRLERAGHAIAAWTHSLSPGQPLVETLRIRGSAANKLTLRVFTADGRELIAYTPRAAVAQEPPPPATEPPLPASVRSADELFLIGQHLEQYRHATRRPEDYWQEALRRDPGDARCQLALGRRALRRGEFTAAETHFRASIARSTSRNPNPADGEAFYQLGLCLRHEALAAPELDRQRIDDAYAAFYKATWNHAWQPAGFHALGEIDALRGDWLLALEHLDRALRVNADNLRARNLRTVALRKLGRDEEARRFLTATLALDPLDAWARQLDGQTLSCDAQVILDLSLDQARAGLFSEALHLLGTFSPSASAASTGGTFTASIGTAPLLHYYSAWLAHLAGDQRAAARELAAGAKADTRYCFPARLEEIAILEHAIRQNPRDARAPLYLGHLLYDRGRHREAITHWERAVKLEPGNAMAWRNLGIGCFNILRQPARAKAAYQRAFQANPRDARLLFERDQLWKRLRVAPAQRLRELRRRHALVGTRDDLSLEFSALCHQTGAYEAALSGLLSRAFQPWEGGEGQVLGQYVRTCLALGRRALQRDDATAAATHFSAALTPPRNLGEAHHLLANQSDIHYWLGCAFAAAGQPAEAAIHWKLAAEFKGDFQSMSVRTYSDKTYYTALALRQLGRNAESRRLLQQLLKHGQLLAKTPATIDYFATSLPTMLLFTDDLSARQTVTGMFLEAQARLGLGERTAAQRLLRAVLRRDPNHALAADFLAEASLAKQQRLKPTKPHR